jgi:hypothetical protein
MVYDAFDREIIELPILFVPAEQLMGAFFGLSARIRVIQLRTFFSNAPDFYFTPDPTVRCALTVRDCGC